MSRTLNLYLFLIICMLVLTTPVYSQAHFFGMAVNEIKDSFEAFEIVKTDGDNFTYNYNPSKVNKDLSCNGFISRTKSVAFTIKNNTKAPIKMNYYADTYELMYDDGTIYQLEHPDDISYMTKYPSILNPGNSVDVILVGFNGDTSKVKYLSASLPLSDLFIFLKRVD